MDGRIDEHFARFQRTGSARALTRVFDLAAPGLLLIARRLTRDAVLAEDLVQATFVAVIESASTFDPGRAGSAGVWGWLVGVLSNQARRAQRHRRRSLNAERLAPGNVPSPVDVTAHRELTGALRRALASLPARYREVLELELLHGMSQRDIARALDRPRQTVKTQARRGMELLRGALPRGFALGTVTALLAGRGVSQLRRRVVERAKLGRPNSSVALPVVSVAAVVLLGTGGVLTWSTTAAGASNAPRVAEVPTPAPTGAMPAALPVESRRPVVRSGLACVEVRVVFARDRCPANGSMVALRRMPLDDRSYRDVRWLRTDASGSARFSGVAPGHYSIRAARGGERVVSVRGSDTAHTELSIPVGVTVNGEVLDVDGKPLAGAGIGIGHPADPLDLRALVQCTDARGRFTLRDVEPGRLVGVYREGHASSGLQPVGGIDHPSRVATQTMRFRSPSPAGTLEGSVCDVDGRPVPGALVMVGHCNVDAQAAPIQTGTDGRGVFRLSLVCIQTKTLVWVRAADTAAAVELVELPRPGSTRRVDFVLRPGCRVSGTIRDSRGEPVVGALVEAISARVRSKLGRPLKGPRWLDPRTHSVAGGRFELTGVMSGRVTLRAEHAVHGRAFETRRFTGGDVPAWDAQLCTDLVIRGRVVDSRGGALAGWCVTGRGTRTARRVSPVRTDREGRFVMASCDPVPYRLRLTDAANLVPGIAVELDGVWPGARELSVVVPEGARPSASVTARMLGPDSQLLKANGARLVAEVDACHHGSCPLRIDSEGRLHAGPLAPGKYYLLGGARDYGSTRLAEFTLSADEHLDLGMLKLAPPGWLDVTVLDATGLPSTARSVAVKRAGEVDSVSVRLREGRGVSRPVQPGHYWVSIWSNRTPMTYRKVEVRSGERKVVVLQHGRGVQRMVRFPGVARPGTVLRFDFHGEPGQLLARSRCAYVHPKPVTRTLMLDPGEYTVTLHWANGRVRRGRFRVDDSPWSDRAIVLPGPDD